MVRQLITGLLLILFSLAPAQANSVRLFSLSADEWAQPRSGAVVSEFAAVRAAVNYGLQVDDAVIVIRYPGEDSGELWASELRDWLVTLGISGSDINLVAGTGEADQITLAVGTYNDLI